ncbi:MAG: hypothetical protein H6855_03790 [Rhodospirillales bacterium]|nr:hypothetical protein [Rhodospirillales bacterium]MCB9965185.1 hypothetical protein [Rhodospirillales bacterium]MCB9973204.1 hypothetical protein [Rhodospirillales bacterium]MCB9979536.1 hypothetical protein [Rhodospirillales bacterium]
MSDEVKKFFFNRHNFDENAEEDEGPPPPPMFTEAEMAAAKDTAYRQGKKDGFQESQDNLERKISLFLEQARQGFLMLQTQEAAREKQYEEEAVRLALSVFHRIYPAWMSACGAEDVTAAIQDVLRTVSNQQQIRVEVSSEILSAVEERLKPTLEMMTDVSVSFYGREDFSAGDMMMKWESGGALRDSRKLAERILQSLEKDLPAAEEALAEPPETRQDDTTNTGPDMETID